MARVGSRTPRAARAGLATIGTTNNEMSPLVPRCQLDPLVEGREVSLTGVDAALARLTRLDDLAALVPGPKPVGDLER